MRLLITFLAIPFLLQSYTFNSTNIGLCIAYRQDEMSWSFSDTRIPEPNSIKEKIDDMHIIEIGIQASYLEPMMPYGRMRALYGFSWSDDNNFTLIQKAQSSDQALTAIINNQAIYSLSGHIWDTKAALGYTYQFGPISFAPVIGFMYEAENCNRKNAPEFFYSNNNNSNPISATSGAGSGISFLYYAPLIGLDLIFHLGPYSNIQIQTGYEYLYGWFYMDSSYYLNSSVEQQAPLQTTGRTEKTNIHVSEYAYANVFHLNALIGINAELTVGIDFEYEARNVKAGVSQQEEKGIETISTSSSSSVDINQIQARPFEGLFWQSFQGRVNLSWSF